MIVRLRRTLERDPQQRRKTARERGRKDRVAFDHAGVAVGGLLARSAEELTAYMKEQLTVWKTALKAAGIEPQ